MKKEIEKLFREYFLFKEKRELINQPWKDITYCIHGRIEYEILKLYEEHPTETLCKTYVQNSRSYRGGLCVDLNLITETIWIPEYFIKSVELWNNFEIFEHDEFNALLNIYHDNDILIKKVLYCKDENNSITGDKFDLFLNNYLWRNNAKKYSILLIKNILERDKKHYSNTIYSEYVEYVANLYLNQIV